MASENGAAQEAIRRLTDVSNDCVQGLLIASQQAEALRRTIDALPETIGAHLQSITASVTSVSDELTKMEQSLGESADSFQENLLLELTTVREHLTLLRSSLTEGLGQTSTTIKTLSTDLLDATRLLDTNTTRRMRSMRTELRVTLWVIVVMLAYALFGAQISTLMQHLWK